MKRKMVVIGFVLVAAAVGVVAFMDLDVLRAFLGSPAQNSPAANSEAERRVLAELDDMRATGQTYMSVGEDAGRLLRLLTEAAGAKHVVEIGTSTGYSGLWFCLALQKTGGRLTTFEINPGRAVMAREHFKKAGVDHLVTVVEGAQRKTENSENFTDPSSRNSRTPTAIW